MERFVRVVAILALLFLSVSAAVGAIPLITDPSGHALHMPLALLQHSPFHNFFLPGVILLLSNGLFAGIVLLLLLRRVPAWGLWIVLQGCVLAGWITIEVLMIRTVVWAHFVYWGLAVLLIACGWFLHRSHTALSNRS